MTEQRNYFKELDEHPGALIAREWDSLNRMSYAYAKNRDELLELIEDSDANITRWKEVLKDTTYKLSGELHDELFRRVFNFLSAMMALVDQTRRLVKKYPSSEFKAEYDRRVSEILQSSTPAVLKGLRNMSSHVAQLPLTAWISLKGANESFRVRLKSQRVLEKFDVDAAFKAELEKHEYIDLLDRVIEYSGQIRELYKWLFDQWPVLEAQNMASLKQLDDEAKEALGRGSDSRGFAFQHSLNDIHL